MQKLSYCSMLLTKQTAYYSAEDTTDKVYNTADTEQVKAVISYKMTVQEVKRK